VNGSTHRARARQQNSQKRDAEAGFFFKPPTSNFEQGWLYKFDRYVERTVPNKGICVVSLLFPKDGLRKFYD
jgi:hypothetical protein